MTFTFWRVSMERIFINNDWLFSKEFKDEYISGTIDSDLCEVRLPHTVCETPFNYFSEDEYQMVSAYRKVIFAPAEWNEKRVFITFEGAAHYAEVFLNGEKIGEHYSGYTAFTIELTTKLKFNEDNILVVKLDSRETLNIPPFGNVIDYMTYGGIYRDVYLDIKEKCYIDDIFVIPEITGKIKSWVSLRGEYPKDARIKQTARLLSNNKVNEILIKDQKIDNHYFSVDGFIENIKLWDINHPHR